jgi:2-phospho-L-lactate guanylyltransferase
MIFALLPVKSPRDAKKRLSGLLTDLQRQVLARTMYEQMLETLFAVRGLDRVAVATADEEIASHARSRGADVFLEFEQHSHSRSADAAARRAAEMGAAAVVLLPIDVPLVTPEEIEGLIAASGPGVVVVPSEDGTGTNALVRNPPAAIPACFGPGSFRKHCEQAEARGIPLQVMRPPGILFDIDTPEDVAELLVRAPQSRIAKLLHAQRGAAAP